MGRFVIVFLLSATAGGHLAAQQADSVSIPAGSRYVARGPLSWLSKWIFGSRYRELWGTPVRMPRFDPAARGLTPIGADTGLREGFLYFRDGGGITWTFRPLDRNIESLLAAENRRDFMTGPIQDLYSGRHPGAPLVVAHLSRGAGLGAREQRLVALVQDSALIPGLIERGIETRFRDELDEKSAAITSTELLAQLDAPDPPTVDVVAYLRERLFDIYVGSWDPLPEEWLWLRRRGGLMVPLPRERDGAFSRFDGLATSLASATMSELSSFKAGYSSKLPMTGQLRILDRRLLTGLDSARWFATAQELTRRLPDSLLASAVDQMPPEYRAINGPELLRQLQVRRDQLPDVAQRYHELLLDRGELYGTTLADTIVARRSAGGVLDVSIGDRVPVRFESRVTDEVRVYPMGGADRIVLRGGKQKGPRLRIAVDSLDVVPDSTGTDGVHFDPGLTMPRFVDNAEVASALLRGTRQGFATWLNFNSDLGLQIGGGPVFTTYDPAYSPWKSRLRLRAALATKPGDGAIDFRGEFRRRHSTTYFRVDAKASAIEFLKYYGYGNETPRTEDSEFYKSDQRHFILAPALVAPVATRSSLEVGVIAKLVLTDTTAMTLISQQQPYGAHTDFGQIGMQASLRYDSRDATTFARRGSELRAGFAAYPGILSAEEPFGMVEGSVSHTVTPLADLTLAARASGKTTWGRYPVHEAAFVGGSRTVRSLDAQRFAGDAAVWGNFETRVRVGTLPFVMDWDWGVFGIADAGRVFYPSEKSSRWHYGLGGGIWAVLPDRSFMGLFDVVAGDDGKLAFWAGVAFIM